MELVQFNIKEHGQIWDDFVFSHIYGTAFHLTKWKNIVEKTYSLKPQYYIVKISNVFKGIIPFFNFNNYKLQHSLISLPYAPYGGMLLCKDISEQDIISKLNWDHKILEFRIFNKNVIVDNSVVTMIIDLPDTTEELWNSYNSKTRQNIRKAEKEGLIFIKGKQFLDDFYNIFLFNMRRLGTPAHSKLFFNNILKEFGNNSNIWAVSKNNKIIAAMIVISYKQTLYDIMSAAYPEYKTDYANKLLNWEAQKLSLETGHKYFDYGRSTKNTGPYIFKQRWGAKEYPLDYYIMKNGDRKKIGVPQPGLISKIWQKLPCVCTDKIGPVLRKYIA